MELDLDLGADLKAHSTHGVEYDGVPDNFAYQPAMPYEMRSKGPQRTFPSTLGHGAVHGARPAWRTGHSWLHSKAQPVPNGALQCSKAKH